uniref:Exonuclease domain-containing protein n=1 Tax=Macrostomum lignano TaxID=282301 RepID=A0A1I8H626_9PLAT
WAEPSYTARPVEGAVLLQQTERPPRQRDFDPLLAGPAVHRFWRRLDEGSASSAQERAAGARRRQQRLRRRQQRPRRRQQRPRVPPAARRPLQAVREPPPVARRLSSAQEAPAAAQKAPASDEKPAVTSYPTAASKAVTDAASGTLVMLDLETTGMEGRQRITELAMLAVHTFNLLEAAAVSASPVANGNGETLLASARSRRGRRGFPAPPGAADLTRLDNKEFDRNAAALIDAFLSRLEPPVVLMAHNGLQFDFPLLRSELNAVGVSLQSRPLCCKSLPLFRKLEPPGSRCGLTELHFRLAGWRPEDAHSAIEDCVSLLRVLSCRLPACLDWVRQQAVPFDSVAPKYVAKRRLPLPDFPYKLSDKRGAPWPCWTWRPPALYQPRVTELALLTADRADLLRRGGNRPAAQGAEPALPAVQPRLRGDALGREHHRLARRLPAPAFDSASVRLLGAFVRRLHQPVLMVAHNGARFDFPLLQAELRLASAAAAGCSATADAAKCLGSVLCSDSLPALRELQLRPGADALFAEPLKQGKPQVRFSLQQLYSQAFSGEEPPGSHSGLGDCEALLRLLLFRLPDCLPLLEAAAAPFETVAPAKLHESNALFEKYYTAQAMLPEAEWPVFMTAMREGLPVTFRITGFRGHSQSLLKLLRTRYLEDLLSLTDIRPPEPLPWYPSELGR